MLTLKELRRQAELLRLPLEKPRAMAREYAQIIILRALCQSEFGQKMFFMGGTALRFAYDLGRFSEDLDFNAEKLSFTDFKEILSVCQKAIRKEGFESEISQKERKTLLVGEMKLIDILQHYRITPLKKEKLMIKIEANRPTWQMETDSVVINKFGYLFPVRLMAKGALFAEKVNALLNRCRGRDIYDVIFMLQRKFPLDSSILETKATNLKPEELISRRIEQIEPEQLTRLAKQIEPFLLNGEEVDFIINAQTYIKALLTDQR